MRDSSASRYGNRFRTRRLIPPPHGLFLGNLDRSSRRTVTPARASVRAAVAPAGPAPTTKTNDVFGKREPICPKTDHHGGHREFSGELIILRVLCLFSVVEFLTKWCGL